MSDLGEPRKSVSRTGYVLPRAILINLVALVIYTWLTIMVIVIFFFFFGKEVSGWMKYLVMAFKIYVFSLFLGLFPMRKENDRSRK